MRVGRLWRVAYEGVRHRRRKRMWWWLVLAAPALAHRLCTAVASRMVFLCANPVLCCRRPLVFLRFSRRRIKSLLLATKGTAFLADAVEACNEVGMRPFLTFGTLLGHCRENGFLRHDRDIDIGFTEPDRCRLADLRAAMARRGWAVRRWCPHLVTFVKPFLRSVTVDFYLFYVSGEGEVHVHREASSTPTFVCVYPADVLRDFRPVRFAGEIEVLAPVQWERFLAISYGDWRTPVADWHYSRGPANQRLCLGEAPSDAPRRPT